MQTVVNLGGLGVTHSDLPILAPLGCGVQTGAGAFTNIANVQPDHEVAVLGVGGVGMSAILVIHATNSPAHTYVHTCWFNMCLYS